MSSKEEIVTSLFTTVLSPQKAKRRSFWKKLAKKTKKKCWKKALCLPRNRLGLLALSKRSCRINENFGNTEPLGRLHHFYIQVFWHQTKRDCYFSKVWLRSACVIGTEETVWSHCHDLSKRQQIPSLPWRIFKSSISTNCSLMGMLHLKDFPWAFRGVVIQQARLMWSK